MSTVIYILQFMLEATKGLIPFFLLSISIASFIKTLKLEIYLEKAINGHQWISVPIAAGTGSFSPLCSCGVIPAIAAMLAAGIPIAPIMAFWITSPLMSPECFVLTYSILGKEMAVARLVATVVIGLMAGYITLHLSQSGFIEKDVLKSVGITGCCEYNQHLPEEKLSKRELLRVRLIQFFRNLKDIGLFVGKFILVAFFLEALISKYVPMEWIAGLLGKENSAGPIWAALIGIPAYASSISAMPVVRGLMDLGMDKGTALAFMIGGAATSVPAMVAVFSIVKRKIFFLYLTFSMFGAIGAGYIYRVL